MTPQDGRPELYVGYRHFFYAHCTSFHISCFLLRASFSLSLSYFILAVPMYNNNNNFSSLFHLGHPCTSVGDNTQHELHISYNIMNGTYLLFPEKRWSLFRPKCRLSHPIIIEDFTLLAVHHWSLDHYELLVKLTCQGLVHFPYLKMFSLQLLIRCKVTMSFTRPFFLGPVFFRTALPCTGGYQLRVT